jgi:hypothetical protein
LDFKVRYTRGIRGLIIFAISVLLFFCKKKSHENVTLPASGGAPEDNEITTVDYHAYFLNIINDISIMGGQVIETGSSAITSSCAIINFFNNDSVYFDFGSLYCRCQDGVMRKGRLIYDFSASTNGATSFRMPGFVCKIKSVNFGVNSVDISIVNKVIVNAAPLSIANQTAYSGVNLTWKDTSNIQFRLGTLDTFNLYSAETITLSNTNDTTCYKGQGKSLQWEKVKLALNHKSTGHRIELGVFPQPEKESFNASASNLVRDFTCAPPLQNGVVYSERHPFISGVLHYWPGTRSERVYDCGSGKCDNDCQIIIGNLAPFNWGVP